MIAIVPVVFLVPTVFVFVPPAVVLAPAAFTGFAQFATLMVCLTTIAPVVFDRFVQIVLGVLDPALAMFVNVLP
jgi:hypothetical protein